MTRNLGIFQLSTYYHHIT